MRLRIMDYPGTWHDTGIDIDDTVAKVEINVITGDHVATVTFADGHSERIESCFDRRRDWDDGYAVIFDRAEGIDHLREYDEIRACYDLFDIEGSRDNRTLESAIGWLFDGSVDSWLGI